MADMMLDTMAWLWNMIYCNVVDKTTRILHVSCLICYISGSLAPWGAQPGSYLFRIWLRPYCRGLGSDTFELFRRWHHHLVFVGAPTVGLEAQEKLPAVLPKIVAPVRGLAPWVLI